MEARTHESLSVVSANMQDGLSPERMADPEHAARMLMFLGRIAAEDPDIIDFSEAMANPRDNAHSEGSAHGPFGTVSIDESVRELLPNHTLQVVPYNSGDGRHDDHYKVVGIRNDLDVIGMNFVRLGEAAEGRRTFGATIEVDGSPVRVLPVHLPDRPRATRVAQARTIATMMDGAPHALVIGDMNTIHKSTWQARLLRNPLVRGLFRLLPAAEPGRPDQITLPNIPGPLGRVVTTAAGKLAARFPKIARFGSLGQRLTDMAEATKGGGPLEVLESDAHMTVIGNLREISRPLFRWRGRQLGVRIDHAMQRGLQVLDARIIPSEGASDHDALFVRVRPIRH